MSKKSIVNEWLLLAQQDLDAAQFLTNMQPVPIEIICFLCQQSAEKFLKGFLLDRGKKY